MLYSWNEPLSIITKSKKFKFILEYLSKSYVFGNISPEKKDVFNAFKYCDYKDLKVVIIGHEPYSDVINVNPRVLRSTGFAFGNHSEVTKLSPELKNITDELERSYNTITLEIKDITLKSWAEQGVLLLNESLTVENGKPKSHFKLWDGFAKLVVKHISKAKPGTIFLLWGEEAKKYIPLLNEGMWYFTAPHPSSDEFVGCNHFQKVNDNLHIQGKLEIKWI